MTFESVPLTITFHLCFLRISKVWGMLHNGSVGRVQSKQCYFMFTYTFLVLFCLFSSKNCVFIIFISFFDEVSSFRNRILTNQKPELVIRNCQWLFVRISSQTKWSGVIFSWKPQHDKHLGKANSFVCTGVGRNVEASMYFMFYQTRLLFALLFKLA